MNQGGWSLLAWAHASILSPTHTYFRRALTPIGTSRALFPGQLNMLFKTFSGKLSETLPAKTVTKNFSPNLLLTEVLLIVLTSRLWFSRNLSHVRMRAQMTKGSFYFPTVWCLFYTQYVCSGKSFAQRFATLLKINIQKLLVYISLSVLVCLARMRLLDPWSVTICWLALSQFAYRTQW